MSKTLGIKELLSAIFLIFLFGADSTRADGYFRLILIDGTVAEGEMIRITPATIEIDPEGPEEFASYNRSVIKDIIYTKQKPVGTPKMDPIPEEKGDSKTSGYLAVKYNIGNRGLPRDTLTTIHDYVLIDGKLYFTGRFEDFMIGLPSGNHTLELYGIDIAYYEPTDFYSLENGGIKPRVWGGENPYSTGKSMNIQVRGDSVTVIAFVKQNRDILFVAAVESRVISRGSLAFRNSFDFKGLSFEQGIIPGKLVFDELPKNHLAHDSLEYRYSYVFNESRWGRFNNTAYLPGSYEIEARTLAWNRWKGKFINESVNLCEVEINSGLITVVKFKSLINRLDCEVTILPAGWFEISIRESQ